MFQVSSEVSHITCKFKLVCPHVSHIVVMSSSVMPKKSEFQSNVHSLFYCVVHL